MRAQVINSLYSHNNEAATAVSHFMPQNVTPHLEIQLPPQHYDNQNRMTAHKRLRKNQHIYDYVQMQLELN
jgi:hypothetical protein